MPYTTPENVISIIEWDEETNLIPFIETAHSLVEACCVVGGYYFTLPYTDTQLELIERWLSGHFYHVRNNQPSGQMAGKVQEQFQHKVDLLLMNTEYGQQALMLDYYGGLASLLDDIKKPLSSRPKATIKIIGKNVIKPQGGK